MRFIHIADVHLGVIPDAGMPWSEKRSQDIWNSFRLVIEQAKRQQVDLLLIAGDLFHRQPLKRELKEVAAWFAEIPETEIVLIAGNHDYLHPKSYYQTFAWPENVHFLMKRELQAVTLEHIYTTVYGCSFWNQEDSRTVYDAAGLQEALRHEKKSSNHKGQPSFFYSTISGAASSSHSIASEEPYSSEIRMPDLRKPEDLNSTGRRNYRILLGHGGDDRHHPFQANDIVQAGFDYAAFGHIHKAAQLVPNRVIMAGSLEPTDCNDFGPHGFWMGELTEHGCKVSFYPIKKCEYICQEINITPQLSSYAVSELVQQTLQEREPYQISHIILRGYRDADTEMPTEQIVQMERVVRVVDETEPDYQFDVLKQKHDGTLLQKYIDVMEQCPNAMLRKKALYYGVQAMMEAMEEGQEKKG